MPGKNNHLTDHVLDDVAPLFLVKIFFYHVFINAGQAAFGIEASLSYGNGIRVRIGGKNFNIHVVIQPFHIFAE